MEDQKIQMTRQQVEETRTLLEVAGYITACSRMLIENPLLKHYLQLLEEAATEMEEEESTAEVKLNLEGIRYFMEELDRETASVGVGTIEEAYLVAAKMRGVVPNEDE